MPKTDRAALRSEGNSRMTFWLTPAQRAVFLRKMGESGERYLSTYIAKALGLDATESTSATGTQ